MSACIKLWLKNNMYTHVYIILGLSCAKTWLMGNIYDFNKYIYTCIYIYIYKENTEVMMKLGQAMADTGRVEDGLKLTQQAIDKDPHFLIAHLNKAKMHIQVSQASCARCM